MDDDSDADDGGQSDHNQSAMPLMEWNRVAIQQAFRIRGVQYPAMRAARAGELILLFDDPAEQMIKVAVFVLQTHLESAFLPAVLAELMLFDIQADNAFAPAPQDHLLSPKITCRSWIYSEGKQGLFFWGLMTVVMHVRPNA